MGELTDEEIFEARRAERLHRQALSDVLASGTFTADDARAYLAAHDWSDVPDMTYVARHGDATVRFAGSVLSVSIGGEVIKEVDLSAG